MPELLPYCDDCAKIRNFKIKPIEQRIKAECYFCKKSIGSCSTESKDVLISSQQSIEVYRDKYKTIILLDDFAPNPPRFDSLYPNAMKRTIKGPGLVEFLLKIDNSNEEFIEISTVTAWIHVGRRYLTLERIYRREVQIH